jgi:outer membrane protein insertion porin family
LIDEDVRRLYKTRMFVNVKTYSQRVDGGQVVVFEVIERPVLQKVEIFGNIKYNTKRLRKEIDIKSGDAMDPFAVEESRRKLESFYHEKGFSDARVSILEGNRPEDRRARFLIDEGTKQRIWKTKFVGNTIVSGDRLLTQVESKPGFFWLFKGEVDHKKIEEDIDKLTAYYRSLGFFRAKVGRELQFSDDKDWLVLTFVIDEGPRYVVRNIAVIGNSKFGTEELTKESKLKAGQFFNQMQMEADKTKMQDHYGSIGYLFAKVEPDPRFLEEPGQLDLVYTIQEGSRYRVGRINVQIQGEYPHTRITTVLNRLSLHPGEIVDTRQLRASERRLQASGLFASDAASGQKPKIVFSPPDKDPDSDTEVAGKPKRDPGVRGQSPDDDPQTAGGPRPAGDRFIDLEYQGLLKPQQQWPPGALEQLEAWSAQRQQPGTSFYAPQQLDASAARLTDALGAPRADPADGNRPQPSAATVELPAVESMPAGQSQPGVGPALPCVPNRTARPTVVRGQYTPDSGQTVPAYGSAVSGGYGPASPPTRLAQVSVPYASDQPSYNNTPPPIYNGPAASPGNGYSNAPPPGPSYSPSQPLGGPYGPPGQYGSGPGPAASPAPTTSIPPQSPPGYQTPPNGTAAPGTMGPRPGEVPSQVAPPTYSPSEERVFPRPEDSQFARPLDLDVITKETQTGRLMFGVGINSDAGLVGNVTIDEQNFDISRVPQSWEDVADGTAFRGAGQRLRIEAVPGTQVSRYQITFQEPNFLDTDFVLGLSGYYYERLYREWTEQRIGGRVSLGYQINHDLSATTYFRGENVDITNPALDPTIVDPVTGALLPPPDLQAALGPSGLYGFGVTVAHDTRDSQFLPTEGHFMSVNFEDDIGSFQFSSVDIDFKKYFLLYERPDGSGRHVLTLSTHVGVKSDNTPIFEKYYAGGFSTIRGFDFRGVSPVSPGDIHIGGDAEILASAEYMYPITADDMLRGVVFCDSGTVEPSFKNWNNNYRVAPGLGLRIVVPAMGQAPIALDLAFPVSVNPGDRVLNFSFFVGFGR